MVLKDPNMADAQSDKSTESETIIAPEKLSRYLEN